jgi:hypothetical protein
MIHLSLIIKIRLRLKINIFQNKQLTNIEPQLPNNVSNTLLLFANDFS